MRLFLKLTCIFIVLILVMGCSTSMQTSRTSLFNGTNFDGWTFFLADSTLNLEDVWSVSDGIIQCKGMPNGYLKTADSYTNYKLHLEWRWVENPTNSGVLLHCQGPDQIWPNAFECQLMAGSAGDFVLIGPGHVTVDDSTYAIIEGYQIIARQNESSEKPAGEWNTYDITSDGSTVTAVVNGVVQNIGTELALTSGPILLQSEGSSIEFRNIWIESL